MPGKPPAFQFYAKDFLLGAMHMSLIERGAYITLMSYSWDCGPLPKSEAKRAQILGLCMEDFRVVWQGVADKWVEIDAGFVNLRLEQQRADLDAYREEQVERGKRGAERRWNGKRHSERHSASVASAIKNGWQTDGSPISDLHTADQDQEPTTALLTFPTVGAGAKAWDLEPTFVAELQSAYPTLDVIAQCRQAHAWVRANRSRTKTAKGMKAFLVSWLNRSVDRMPSQSRPVAVGQTRGEQAVSAFDRAFDALERVHEGRTAAPEGGPRMVGRRQAGEG